MVIIGVDDHDQYISLNDDQRRRHLYAVGKTGVGKSTLLEAMMYQDLFTGRGFAFIDPHGDSSIKLANIVPNDRTNDVLYFDPSDEEFAVALNPLSGHIGNFEKY